MSDTWMNGSGQYDGGNSSRNSQDRQETVRNGKDFWVGAIAGFLVMLVICLILIAFMVKRLEPSKQLETSKTDSDFYQSLVQMMGGGDTVLDEETEQTLKEISAVFENYSIYDMPVEDMRRGMIDGLIAGTGDRYAEYFTDAEFRELMTNYDGVIFGIGATMFLDDDKYLTVQKVFADSPADKAGILAGDIILEVDGEDIYGKSLTDCVNMIRGERYTEVNLLVYREGENQNLSFTITRDEVKRETVRWEMLEDSIGYIQVDEFDEVTIEQYRNALDSLQKEQMQALIIDLRSNTGGLLNAVVDMLRMMLPEGMVVYTEDAFGKRTEYLCDGRHEMTIPMVVLTNEYTASASEIMTGALQDYKMATVMGTRTFGKGVVQSFMNLHDGSALKLTLSQYYTAGGRAIDGEGIIPDIEVPFDGETYYGSNRTDDNQKKAALAYLQEVLAK